MRAREGRCRGSHLRGVSINRDGLRPCSGPGPGLEARVGLPAGLVQRSRESTSARADSRARRDPRPQRAKNLLQPILVSRGSRGLRKPFRGQAQPSFSVFRILRATLALESRRYQSYRKRTHTHTPASPESKEDGLQARCQLPVTTNFMCHIILNAFPRHLTTVPSPSLKALSCPL